MSGINSQTTDSATTPGRITNAVFDPDELVAAQPKYSMERWKGQIRKMTWATVPGQPVNLTSYNTTLLKGVGWRLSAELRDSSNVHELGAPVVTCTVPTNFASFNTWCQSDQNGVLYAGAVAATGDAFYKKNFVAGTSLSDTALYALAGDQASFPTVTSLVGAENSPMYRVGIAQGITSQQELYFSFKPSGNPVGSQDYVATFYFNGPQGWLPNKENYGNTGYYALAFRGDGQCEFYVLLSNTGGTTWRYIQRFRYAPKNQVMGRIHRIGVLPVKGLYPSSSAGSIMFDFSTPASDAQSPLTGQYADGILRAGVYSGDQDASPFQSKWTAPGQFGATPPANGPPRIDTRMDSDVQFQVAESQYATTGVLLDAPFKLGFLPDTSEDFVLSYWASIPAGCTITAAMYEVDSNGVGMAPDFTSLGSGGSGTAYTPIEGATYYCVAFTFTGHGTATPILYGYRVERPPNQVIVSPGTFSPQLQSDVPAGALRGSYLQRVEINLANDDPSSAMASCLIKDINANCPQLQTRGDFPSIIQSSYTDSYGTHNVIYHRGYTVTPESEQYGNHEGGGWNAGVNEEGALTAFNYGTRFDVDVNMGGAWVRLKEAMLPVRYNMASTPATGGVFDPANPPLPKVTDVLRQLFYFGGYDPSQLHIPDLSVKVYPGADGDSLVLDPQTDIADVIKRLCYDYIGGYIYFEANVGTYGTWILQQPVTGPNFNYVAAFTTASPGPGKLQNAVQSYGTTTYAGQTIQQYPIFRGGLRMLPSAPEANIILTYGPDESNGAEGVQVSSLWYNVNSFPFGFNGVSPPSPVDNIDWLSRPRWIYEYLPSWASLLNDGLDSPIRWITRRIADVAGYGRMRQLITTPVVVVRDTWTIPGTTFYRPAKFYDAVLVNGVPCLIRSAKIHYTKDEHQMATYLVEQLLPQYLNGTAYTQPSRISPEKAIAKMFQRLVSGYNGEKGESPKDLAIEKRSYGMTADIFNMPAQPVNPLQNTDGSNRFILGLDPVV